MKTILSLAFIIQALGTTSVIGAQPVDNADPASRIRALYASVGAEADCVDAITRTMRESIVLLEEAETQLSHAGSDQAVRDAAIQTMEALWLRVREAAAGIATCRRDHLGAERIIYDAEGNPMVMVDPAEDEAADRVGTEGNSLHTVDSGSRIAGQVWVIRGEHVDGAGTLDPSRMRRGVHAIGQNLEACYRTFSRQSGADGAEAAIHIEVTRSGRISRVEVEELRPADRRFGQCLRQSFQRIGRFPRFTGGTMTWGYRLRFGAEQTP